MKLRALFNFSIVLGVGVLWATNSNAASAVGDTAVLDDAAVPPVMVQLEILFDAEEDPATILVPFGEQGTLTHDGRTIVVKPQVADGRQEIRLELEVADSDVGTASAGSAHSAAWSSETRDGGVVSWADQDISVGAQVVASQTLEPVAELSRDDKRALCNAVVSDQAGPKACGSASSEKQGDDDVSIQCCVTCGDTTAC